MGNAPSSGPVKRLLKKRLYGPIKTQLTQGATPLALSRAIATGCLGGIFPILGSTTLLVTAAGIVFKLNQTVLQTINWFIYPLQLALILPFIRFGEMLHGAEHMPISIPQLLERFQDSPGGFFAEFGITLWHAIAGWLMVAPPLWLIIRTATLPVLKKAAARLPSPS